MPFFLTSKLARRVLAVILSADISVISIVLRYRNPHCFWHLARPFSFHILKNTPCRPQNAMPFCFPLFLLLSSLLVYYAIKHMDNALPSLSRFLSSVMQAPSDMDFFTEYGEGSRYKIEEVIGKGSYGVVCSALDTHTGEKVAIKKINDIFEHVSDATRILREIKLLRLLRHLDIVEIKHILLPPSRREFRDIYVVFELMESDLHQVIKANDDLTPEHYQFFLYQLLRGLKYIHTGN
jgi:serine/threonine protein kinase